jgi:two-component system OmpR family response regulator
MPDGSEKKMRVLIAEDDDQTASFIAEGLAAQGHQIERVADGCEALAQLERGGHDIVILDRMLPQVEGLEILRQVRARGDGTPILMLTALGQIADRVDGLDAGADDYLVKPFAQAELLARLAAILRRRSSDAHLVALEAGPLTMDLLRREACFEGRIIALQPREMRLLEELMRNPNKVVTRTMLLERVWDFHFDPQTNLVETHMSRLRAKLSNSGAKDIIETVRGAGYRLRVTTGG